MRLLAKRPGKKTMAKLIVSTIVTLCFLLVSFGVHCEQDERFQVEIKGQKTWSFRYGLGDLQGLAQAGLAPYQISLDQSLAVDITGEALSILTIDAHFNDQEPLSMQSLTVNLNAGDLQGVFGDFSMTGKEAFAVYNKKLKGIRLDYRIGEARLTGIVSQIEGISESKTFIGRTAHEEVLFSSSPPGQPWLDQPYLRNIAGLYHYELDEPFVEGFSEVTIDFDPSEGLKGLLRTYGLAYLFDLIADSPSEELSKGSFTVVRSTQDVLLLKSEPTTLLRDRLKEAIKEYNQKEGLTGAEKKRYPFNTGTDYERIFLDRLASFTHLVVDGTDHPLAAGGRRRFYDLRRTNLKEDSLVVEVSLAGGTFRPITDPDFADYQAVLFPTEGIIELDFPTIFFEDEENAVRVSFDYAISGDMFMLGLSLLPGSEKVYLNGTLLERDVDYSIDYEIGALILFVEVGDEDTIRIDYERFRGGLGGFAEYARNFYGASLRLPVCEVLTLDLSLLQAADSSTPLVDPDKARTMPNTHTVSGVVGSVRLDDFTADFVLGYNHDQFPFDNNLRTNLPNEVNSILALPDYTFVGHLAGISVYHCSEWTGYDTSDGLSGNRVYDMTSDGTFVFFATSSGLTILSMEGEAPLAQVGNWRRYYLEDGLPNTAVHALALVDGILWVGTEEGLASVRVGEIDDPAGWRTYADKAFTEIGSILALAGDGEILYVGTDRGLFAFDEASESLTQLPGTRGLRVHDLLLVNQTLYMACGLGLRTFHNGIGTGWPVFDEAVYSLAILERELWYGTKSGLFRSSDQEPVLPGWEVTALAVTQGETLWAGSRADENHRLMVWRVEDAIEPFDDYLTGIDGRDRCRFADIPVADHTDRGFLGKVGFHRDMGWLSLWGSFESISPRFTSIGRLGRSDSTGWDLSGTAHPLDGIDLTASHSYRLLDQESEQPKSTVENRISLKWDFGPCLDLSLQQGMVNDDCFYKGFDSGSFSYGFNLQDRMFDERLDLSLRWSDAFSENFLIGASRRENRLGIEGGYQLTPEISITARWERPMTFRSGESSGSEKHGLSVDWSHRFSSVSANAGCSLSASRSLPTGTFRTSRAASLDLGFERFEFRNWQVTPDLKLSLEDKEGIASLEGKGTLRGKLDLFSARVTYTNEISGLKFGEPLKEQSGRLSLNDRISVNLDYTGFPDLKPALTYTRSSKAVIYKGEKRPSVTHALTGRLSWTPHGGARDDLSISLREVTSLQGATGEEKSTFTLTIRNSFTYTLSEAISSRVDLDGRYTTAAEGPDLDLTLKGSTDFTLSETWRASLSASYLTGTKSTGDLYHSLFFELFVAVTF